MSPAPVITIQLDRERAVRWTNRAQARNASLPRPAAFADIVRSKKRLYVLCAIIWSALVDKDHEFDAPEDLADYLETADQQLAAIAVVRAMVAEAFPEKKSEQNSTPSPAGQVPSPPASSPPATTGT